MGVHGLKLNLTPIPAKRNALRAETKSRYFTQSELKSRLNVDISLFAYAKAFFHHFLRRVTTAAQKLP
jgi:hypothetical protein